MSKITFRADDELVDALEELDVSKSEALREALRSYLEGATETSDATTVDAVDAEPDTASSLDDLVRERVDELVADRLEERTLESPRVRQRADPQDFNVTINLEGDALGVADGERTDEARTVERDPGHERGAHAPREGESVRRREAQPDVDVGGRGSDTQCSQCGETVDGDHVYCPNCGEKRSRRLFCDCGDELRSDWSFCPGCGRRTPAADVLEHDRS